MGSPDDSRRVQHVLADIEGVQVLGLLGVELLQVDALGSGQVDDQADQDGDEHEDGSVAGHVDLGSYVCICNTILYGKSAVASHVGRKIEKYKVTVASRLRNGLALDKPTRLDSLL